MGARALTLTRMDMDEALVSRQIHLLYQPLFSLKDGGLDRVEALVRWDHPRFGTMLPAVFLPAFEAEDKLTGLTRRILERALAEFVAWSNGGPVGLSINLAARDCTDPALVQSVAGVLEATGIDPQTITLECPVKIADAEDATPILRRLKDMGVRLAAEMMGRPGLTREVFAIAPFDEVKTSGRGLFRARFDNMAGLRDAHELVEFTRERGASVTAIGAEDETACAALSKIGFDRVQANVLSPAVAIGAVTQKATSRAREILGLGEHAEERKDEAGKRLEKEAEAFMQAVRQRRDADDEVAPKGAKAMQENLAARLGEEPEAVPQEPSGGSTAGLLMRTDLAASSLGYGYAPSRRGSRKERAAVIVVEPSEASVRDISKKPAVAEAISDMLGALPAEVEDRGEWDNVSLSPDAKADVLDAEVAKLPPIQPDEPAATRAAAPPPVSEELHQLAAKLRRTEPQKSFLEKKYKLRVTHFWPRPWRRAYLRLVDRIDGGTQSGASAGEQKVMDRLGGAGRKKDAVAKMPLGSDQRDIPLFSEDKRAGPADKGAKPVEMAEAFGAIKTR